MAAQTFTAWMVQVDRQLQRFTGLDSRDLPDWDYWSAWDADMTPAAAAKEAAAAAYWTG